MRSPSEVVATLAAHTSIGANMNDNLITVTGNVCGDVTSRTTASGYDVTSFRLASTPRRFRNGSWEDGETVYLTVNCWRTLGQHVFASVHRGDPVLVRGMLRVRTFEHNGAKGTSVEIEAMSVGHDLARGTTSFDRAQRAARGAESSAPLAVEAVEAGLRADSAAEALAVPAPAA